MCYHNYSQHNGCGHIGESHTLPWTLCDTAIQNLNALRGPNSPPISSPTANYASPPKRSSSTRRFFSLSGQLSRSSTNASTNSRRAVSGPSGTTTPRTSDSSSGSYNYTMTLDYSTLPDHQLAAVKCANPIKRTHVSRDMVVCKDCAREIGHMRNMIQRYDKTGSIRGTAAFEKFLKWEGEGGGEREGDLTVPVDDDNDGGSFGARQAIIMGHPESVMNAEGPRGLGTLEREGGYDYRY
ncbi:uncharacterized protein J4E88_009578 [Alternaria novae-zelandiae]|uniref:uncharacterized protein n=1 Tax=Alternaria viburni TaxID=566460 RepID=UPI0020C49BBE|nr:uncharacterized protein J4E79_001218 [Alternaria viburni]XP_049226879.1 uncharacterized protein J4E78_000935 [Alternaria triticimaculans]XP_049250951.1 uncharacterized protein J4E88_009578 [Alternaria novae-zelandiae]XP_051329164.1 uncharacterized protein J4E85_002029 [Alternaria conjuncta]XP_051357870.1 uncharacterized protein J4E92_000944 [Alternaria infectoria]KAI4623895.1 hypothetical protein J4E80_003707 [Alternaria sp. BMP 0032]KAI4709477.1 hypothetical protein J4E89_005493 [Alternar